MPCSLCDSQNEEIKICIGCYNFLNSLKCGTCSTKVSLRKLDFHIYCKDCIYQDPEEIINSQKDQFIKIINKEIKDEKTKN